MVNLSLKNVLVQTLLTYPILYSYSEILKRMEVKCFLFHFCFELLQKLSHFQVVEGIHFPNAMSCGEEHTLNQEFILIDFIVPV